MSEIKNKIIHVKSEDGLEHYSYNFSLIGKLNEDDDTTYCGLNVHAEVIQLIREQFYWNLIKFAYNLDMDKDEDALFLMQKIYPENFKDMTLEEFNNIKDITDLK